MSNVFVFLQSVRAEAGKITWPTRRETLITSLMVIAMAIMASLFFLAVDWVIQLALAWMLSLGH